MSETVRRRLLIGLGLVVAAGLLVFGFTRDQAREGTTASGGDAVENLIPADGSEALAQGTIGVDLAPGYTGTLTINGAAVPSDELVDDRQQYQILYQPSPESALGDLPAGENCATARIWDIAEGEDESRLVTWCFNIT